MPYTYNSDGTFFLFRVVPISRALCWWGGCCRRGPIYHNDNRRRLREEGCDARLPALGGAAGGERCGVVEPPSPPLEMTALRGEVEGPQIREALSDKARSLFLLSPTAYQEEEEEEEAETTLVVVVLVLV